MIVRVVSGSHLISAYHREYEYRLDSCPIPPKRVASGFKFSACVLGLEAVQGLELWALASRGTKDCIVIL